MFFGPGRTPGRIPGVPILATGLLGVAFATVCLFPHAARLEHSSIYGDDVIRIADLQTRPLNALLFRPFNEHVAPLFELVSWTTWQLAGRVLSRAAVAFTVATLFPFLLCLVALGELVRRESSSWTTGLAATALFCLSAVHAEAVWNYSASSFMWALLGAIGTWLCVLRALARDGSSGRASGWWLASIMAAAGAPACSAIGLLAGPLGSVRVMQVPGLTARRRLLAILPLSGSLLYLIIAGGARYFLIIGTSVQQSSHHAEGLLCCLRAPADVLLPGLLGLTNADRWLGGGADLVLSTLLVLVCLFVSRRSSSGPLILGGLVAMLGGYAITYTVRDTFGPHWLMEVQRYHLFPEFGLVLILAAAVRGWLCRLDARPSAAILCATALALVLLAINRPLLTARVLSYNYPGQRETLRALDGLSRICREYGITRAQAMRALGPVRPSWFPVNDDALGMLADSVKTPLLTAEEARRTLLSGLSLSDREALCGGMEVTPLLRPISPSQGDGSVDICRLVGESGFSALGPRSWLTRQRRAFLEFELNNPPIRPAPGPARWLCVPVSDAVKRIEVWWGDGLGPWSEARSVHWRPGHQGPSWPAVPLEQIPHWTARAPDHIRIVVQADHAIMVETPRLLR
jgi:hypothetical protein